MPNDDASAPPMPAIAPTTLGDLLDRACHRHPDHGLAVVDADGRTDAVRYPELRAAALASLTTMERAGARPTDRVILQFRQPARFLEAFWACQLGGLVPVPVTPLLAAPPDMALALGQAWSLLGGPLVITDEADADLLRRRLPDAIGARVLALKPVVRAAGKTASGPDLPADRLSGRAEPSAPALMLLTSGSTGTPKLVIQTHRALLAQIGAAAGRCGCTATDVSLNWLPLEHVGALVMSHLRDVHVGCRQVQAPIAAVLDRPVVWLDWMERFRVTVGWAPHFAYARVAAMGEAIAARPRDLSSVRLLINGGESIVPGQARAFLRALQPAGLHDEVLWPAWGMSETCSGVTFSDRFRAADDEVGPVDLGAPIDGVELRIVDATGARVADGVEGELQVRGRCVTLGYYGAPAATSAAFAGAGWFRTGDRGRLREGRLCLLGRADDVLTVNGRNIASADIEAAAQAVPGVRPGSVAAFGALADGAPVLVYEGLLRDPGRVAATTRGVREAVASACGLRIDSVIALDAGLMPRTAIGKIRRAELIRQHDGGELPTADPAGLTDPAGAAPVPDGARGRVSDVEPEPGPELEPAPLSATEADVAGLWRTLLGAEPSRATDDFFALGGQSLDAIRLAARVQRQFGVDLPPVAVFDAPSLGAYARLVESAAAGLPEDGPGSPPDGPTRRRPAVATSPLRATPAQQALWLLERFEPTGSAYCVAQTFRIDGPLDVPALGQALQALADRHDALRTCFREADGQLDLVVHESADLPLAVVDVDAEGDIPGDLVAARCTAARCVQDFIDARFDLAVVPLVRAQLVRLGPGQHLLTLAGHHAVTDGWSQRILAADLGVLYSAHRAGRPAALPPLAASQADQAAGWQDPTEDSRLQPSIGYWRARLAGLEPLGLPTDRPRRPGRSYRGDVVTSAIDRETTGRLRALAIACGSTLHMLLLAAFQTLLMRHTGRTDIAVGTPVTGRSRGEFEAVAGYFVNMVVIRTDLSGEPGFRELVRRVRAGSIDAIRHQAVPFSRVVAALSPGRVAGMNPLFQASFTLENAPPSAPALTGAACRPVRTRPADTPFDLSLTMTEDDDGLDIGFAFAAELFDRDRIERMSTHLQRLLCAIIADPDAPIGGLDLLGAEEYRKVVVEWNATFRPYELDTTLVALFEAQVRRTPGAPALLGGGGDLDYRGLNARANRLAHHLRSRGIAPDRLVALCLDHGIDRIVAMLAVLKAGGAYLPLDADLPAGRVERVLAESRPAVVVTQAALIDPARLPPGTVVVRLDADAAAIANCPVLDPPRVAAARDLAYVLYTSGSTGGPKGVMVEHRALLNHTRWFADEFGMTATDRFLQRTGIGFDAAGVEIWPALITGAGVVVADPVQRSDPPALLELVRHRQVTMLQVVPPLLALLLDEIGDEPVRLPLRTAFVGGDVLSARDAAGWRRLTGVELVNLYGPTECTIDAAFHRCDGEADTASVPIGRPVANCRIHLLDAALRPVPVGVTGEICIAGHGVARGYLGAPDRAAPRFVDDPFDPGRGARLYRSGDFGRFRADGRIEYLGRRDRQVKIRGFRVELDELESALIAGGASQAAVLALRDPSGSLCIVAYVAPADLDPATVRGGLAATLPGYMLPATIVAMERLPQLPNGKLDRKALPPPDFRGADAAAVADLDAEPEGWRSPTEATIAAIWAEVLGFPVIGRRTDFLDVGGHSLGATRIAARIARSFSIAFRVSDVFDAATPAAMAAVVDERLSGRSVGPASGPASS